MNTLKYLTFLSGLGCFAAAALADEAPQPLALKDHKFSPSTIHVKANEPTVISLTNKDDTAEEFNSTSLKVEKVVAGHSPAATSVCGRWRRADIPSWANIIPTTAQGVVIAE